MSDLPPGPARIDSDWGVGRRYGCGPHLRAIIPNEHSRGWVFLRPQAVPKNDRRLRLATGKTVGGDEEGPPARSDLGLRHPSAQADGLEQGQTPNGEWAIPPDSGLAT
jgi:hypothetical protein